MSDRTFVVHVEKRSYSPDELRIEDIRVDRRILEIQEEDRALEVMLP